VARDDVAFDRDDGGTGGGTRSGPGGPGGAPPAVGTVAGIWKKLRHLSVTEKRSRRDKQVEPGPNRMRRAPSREINLRGGLTPAARHVSMKNEEKEWQGRVGQEGGSAAERELAARAGGVCDDYRVDVEAPAFGQCLCGHPKSAHAQPPASPPAAAAGKEKPQPRVMPPPTPPPQEPYSDEDKYRRILEATETVQAGNRDDYQRLRQGAQKQAATTTAAATEALGSPGGGGSDGGSGGGGSKSPPSLGPGSAGKPASSPTPKERRPSLLARKDKAKERKQKQAAGIEEARKKTEAEKQASAKAVREAADAAKREAFEKKQADDSAAKAAKAAADGTKRFEAWEHQLPTKSTNRR